MKGMCWVVDYGVDIINFLFMINMLDWDESWDDVFFYVFEYDVVVVVVVGNWGSGINIIGVLVMIFGVLMVGGVD